VLVTAGVGPYEPLLALALPSFAEYAERHGYELVCGDGSEAGDRPAGWAKVPLLRRAWPGPSSRSGSTRMLSS
jgi:hypothetical protein